MANSSTPPLIARPLFGGAIQLALPTDFLDASDLRQIPDNQEVFLSPSSDTSLVVEVLAMVEDGLARDDLWEAAKFHFSSLSHDNASLQSTILTPPPSTPLPSSPSPLSSSSLTPPPTLLTGLQRIHKYSHDPSGAPRPGHEADHADEVWIGLALWRIWLEGGGTEKKKKKADVVCSVNVNLTAEGGGMERERVEAWWTEGVNGLRIVDFGLFGDAE